MKYNPNIYNKNTSHVKSVIDSVRYNGVFFIVYFIVFFIIGDMDNDILKTLFTGYFMAYYAYFTHRFLHYVNPFNKLHLLHHTKDLNKIWYNKLIEWIVNIVFISGGILIPFNIILDKFGLNFLNTYGILGFMIIYTTHHLINYHYLDIHTHVTHHKSDIEINTKQNENVKDFGPDPIDVVFKTKNNMERYEDMKATNINLIVFSIIFIVFFKSKYDFINRLRNYV